jgi:hypothetical protein
LLETAAPSTDHPSGDFAATVPANSGPRSAALELAAAWPAGSWLGFGATSEIAGVTFGGAVVRLTLARSFVNGSIAVLKSATDAKRSFGSGAIALCTMSARPGGTCGARSSSFAMLPERYARGDLVRLVSPHGPTACEHLEEDHAAREDVGAGVDGVRGEDLLRGHVLGRAHDHAGPREALVELAVDLQLGDPKSSSLT